MPQTALLDRPARVSDTAAMATAEQYRARAAEMRHMAERPDTPLEIREQYLKLALDWDRLARQAEPKGAGR